MGSIFPFHSSISDDLIIVANSFNLLLSAPINSSPTKFSDTVGESNLVINLMVLHCNSAELDCHFILPDYCLFSNYALLTIDIPIGDKIIQLTKLSVVPGSD